MLPQLLKGQTKEVCFMDAGAGIVRFDFIENEYSFACFSDIFFPHDVVYDPVGNWVYWTAWTTDRIYKCRPDGTEVDDPIQGVSHVRGIEIDTQNNFLYWVEKLDNQVMKYNILLDHSSELTSVIENPEDVVLDIENGRLFVSGKEGIYSVNDDGSNLTLLLNEPGIKFLEYDPLTGYVYYSSHTQHAIKRMSDTGEDVVTLANVSGLPDGLAIDDVNQRMYWTDWESGTVTRAKLDGTERSTIISSGGNISGVFVDPGTSQLFWLDQDLSEVHRSGILGQNDTTIIEGETWKWIRDFQVSLADDKLFVIDDFKEQIVRTDRNGYNREVIVDSVPGATRIAFDQYSQKLYWSDYNEQCIYVKDLRKNITRRIVENVYAISMDIDYHRHVLCFVDQLSKSIKTYALFLPIVKTIPTPVGTEPKALGVQVDPQLLYWIDDVEEAVYRHVLGTTDHSLSFDEDGESISSIGPGIGAQERFYIHDNRVKYGYVGTMFSEWLYYPGTVFISNVKVTNDFVPLSLLPMQDVDTLIKCKDDLASVRLNVYGAIPPVTYEWSDGYVSDYYHRYGIPHGDYQVTVTDSRDSSVVMQLKLMLQDFVETSITTENAEGGNNGTASVVISGGLPPYTVLWTGNGINITDQLMIDQLSPGTYHVLVTDMNSCQEEKTFVIELNTGIEEPDSGLRIHPNPATNHLTFDTGADATGRITYQLIDSRSSILQQGEIGSGQQLNIGFLPPGVYMIKGHYQDEEFVHSFVKQ